MIIFVSVSKPSVVEQRSSKTYKEQHAQKDAAAAAEEGQVRPDWA